MVDLSIKLWNALTSQSAFLQYQTIALSMFRCLGENSLFFEGWYNESLQRNSYGLLQ